MKFYNRKIFYILLLNSIVECIMCMNVTSSWENYLDTDRNNNCSQNLSTTNEKVRLVPLEYDCELYTYNFTSSNADSIISIISEVKRLGEGRKINEASRIPADQINVVFFESNEKMESWRLTYENATEKQIYLSRTALLKVEISFKGNWTEYEVSFYYKEYEFATDPQSKNCTDQKGEITSQEISELGQYRPNSVTVYTLMKSQAKNVSSIEIILHYLDIDVAVGEYMLIGAGKQLFSGPPPLFITSEKKEAKYLVNDENAYVVFVSGPTRFRHTGFKISYQQLATEIVVPKDDDRRKNKQDDILQSMPICFYNVSDALQELNKTDKKMSFLKFRKEFASVAIKYADDKKLGAARYLNASYIDLFRVSGIVQFKREEDGEISEALYVMLKIRGAQEGEAAFSRNDLQEIIDLYESKSNHTYEYKIGKCPPEYLYPKWWDIAIYSSLPVLFCLFLVMWAWKRNICQDYCFWPEYKLKEKISKQFEKGMEKQNGNSTQAKGNVYSPEPTVPKIQLYTETGRRYTLGPKNSFAVDFEREISDEDSPSSLNNLQDPSLTTDIQQDNECGHRLETISKIPRKITKQETEHFYDSVKSVDSIRNNPQVTETKL